MYINYLFLFIQLIIYFDSIAGERTGSEVGETEKGPRAGIRTRVARSATAPHVGMLPMRLLAQNYLF